MVCVGVIVVPVVVFSTSCISIVLSDSVMIMLLYCIVVLCCIVMLCCTVVWGGCCHFVAGCGHSLLDNCGGHWMLDAKDAGCQGYKDARCQLRRILSFVYTYYN